MIVSLTTTTERAESADGVRFERFLSWRGHAWISLLMRLYLGYIFLLACWHKILDPAGFAVDVATYQMLPLVTLNFIALVLPWAELFAAIMIIAGWRVKASALLIAGMMVMFMIGLGYALYLGLDTGCGCFASEGVEADPISWMTMARDAFWLALALYVLFLDRRPIGVDGFLARRAEAGA